jgi:hypothetical protein
LMLSNGRITPEGEVWQGYRAEGISLTGVSVETLLDLICCRLEITTPRIAYVHLTLGCKAYSSPGD